MRRGLILCGLFLAGCATTENWYDDAGSGPTPDGWKKTGLLIVVVTDDHHEPLGSFKLRLTNEHLDTVEPDSWPVAWLVESDLPSTIPDAWIGNQEVPSAYSIDGDRIIMNLNASIVDDNIMLRGKLVQDSAAGIIFWSSPFGHKVHGNFVAVKVRWF